MQMLYKQNDHITFDKNTSMPTMDTDQLQFNVAVAKMFVEGYQILCKITVIAHNTKHITVY